MLNKLVFIIRKINLKKKKILLFELFCVVLLVINILLSFSLTFLFAQIVNKLFVEKTNCILDLYLLISITLLNSILSYLKSYLIQNVGKEISFSLKTYLYQEILYKKVEFWDDYTVGELETILVSDINKLEYIITSFYPNMIINILSTVVISSVLIYSLKVWGIIIISMILITIFIQRFFMKKMQQMANDVRNLSAETATVETESLTKAEDIYMSGLQNNFIDKFKVVNKELFDKIIRRNILQEKSSIILSLVQVINIVGMLMIGALLIDSGKLTIEVAISMYVFIQRLNAPINQIISQIYTVIEIVPSIDHIVKLLENNNMIIWGRKDINSPLCSIKYNHLTFRYPNQKAALFEKFDCVFDKSKGKTVIIGENGVGKSTLVKLLFNMCNTVDGNIMINDIDISEVSEETIRKKISYVSQTPLVFSGTIIENLNKHKDYEKGFELLKKLGISSEWINEKKYLEISDKRSNFSGGELQKIAIARVLLEDKDVIIMDEPTSSLDDNGAQNLLKLLDKEFNNKIIIIISHDIRVIEWADLIIDLNNKDISR